MNKNEKQLFEIITKCQKMVNDNNDCNTLVHQLCDLIFKDTVYRTFNEGLRLDSNNGNRPKLLIDQYHELFFKNQVINIRRILDKGEDVYSLRRIFDFVLKNHSQYTRRGYLLANKNQISNIVNIKMKESQIEYLNQQYDMISNTSEKNRSDNDKLFEPYLQSMSKYIDDNKLFKDYTNTYIAHSFNKKKRKLTEKDLSKITLKNLQKMYKDISWLSYTISRYIGKLILFEVPSVPYNQFDGWVGSLYKKNIEKSLKTYWNKRVMLIESWKQKYWFSNDIYLTPYKIADRKNEYIIR